MVPYGRFVRILIYDSFVVGEIESSLVLFEWSDHELDLEGEVCLVFILLSSFRLIKVDLFDPRTNGQQEFSNLQLSKVFKFLILMQIFGLFLFLLQKKFAKWRFFAFIASFLQIFSQKLV